MELVGGDAPVAAGEAPPDSNRATWLQWRRGGLGASDAAAVSGFSRWGSPWSVYVEKVGLVEPDDHDDEMAEFGRRFEPIAAPWFHERTGLYIVGEQTWVTKTGEPWARSTPDGFVSEVPNPMPDELVGTWEVKAPVAWGMWQDGLDRDAVGDGTHAPVDHQVQALWQQWTTGLDRTWFGVLHGRRFRIYELGQDGPDLALVIDRCKRFWYDNVLAGVPPPVDGSDATTAVLRDLWPTHEAGTEVDVGHLRDLIAQRHELKAQIAQLEAGVQLLDNSVRRTLEEAEAGTIDGVPVVTYRSHPTTRIDLARLRAEQSELILGQYAVTDTVRTLRYRKV